MLDSIYHVTLKLLLNHLFCMKNAKILSHTQRYNGRYYIALAKSVNHLCFIDFNAWPYITPRCDVI